MLKYLFISCVVFVFLTCITCALISKLKIKYFMGVYNQVFSKQSLTSLSRAIIQNINLLETDFYTLSTGPIIITKLFNLLLIKGSII